MEGERRHNDDVIVERLGNLIASFNEYKKDQGEYHDRTSSQIVAIHDQVKYTNGKVRKLELAGAYMKGGLAVIAAMVLPMVIWFVTNYIVKR